MISANNAREMTQKNVDLFNAQHKTQLMNWIDKTCGDAVSTAIENRQFNTVVVVPWEYTMKEVQQELLACGYAIQTNDTLRKVVICW